MQGALAKQVMTVQGCLGRPACQITVSFVARFLSWLPFCCLRLEL